MNRLPRYILDIGDSNWESNSNCPICKAVDNQYKYVQEIAKKPNVNKDYVKQQLDVLEGMLVNGYGVVQVLEANSVPHKFKDNLIRGMQTYSDDLVNYAIDKFGTEKRKYNEYARVQPTLYFSRFCKECGSRKPDIFDTEQLEKFDWNFSATIRQDLHSILLEWNKLDYKFEYTVRIWKRADNLPIDETTDKEGYRLYGEFNSDTLSSVDEMVADGRAYYYKLEFLDRFGYAFKTLKTHVLNKVWFDHIPKNIHNLKFRKHKRLLKDEMGRFTTDEYIYASFDVDADDKDFGDVIFKLNADHVPSLDYFIDDFEFSSKEVFRFPNRKQKYFIKPYIRSKLFKKDWDYDHQVYPDLYFWNTDASAQLINYDPFREDLYNLKFEDGIRSMKITYKLKGRNEVKYVRIMFKQDNQYITDDDDGTYKVVDVPVDHALYDYEVNINGLASNTYWVFGVFPVYEDCDPDIRLEYQTIVKIRPWFDEDEWFDDPLDFYYTGYWYWDYDFDRYDVPQHNKIRLADCRKKEVIMCDEMKMKEVAPLLIHKDHCSECITLDFDFKMITKTQQDRMHSYVNHKRQLKVVDTNDKWMHYNETFYGLDWLILRWEQMKFSDSAWTCTYVDNIHLHSETVEDKWTDNFTREDKIEYTNYRYYNHRIKHNSLYRHTPDKYYTVNIQIDPYYDEKLKDKNNNGIDDIDEEYTVGKPDEHFTWKP